MSRTWAYRALGFGGVLGFEGFRFRVLGAGFKDFGLWVEAYKVSRGFGRADYMVL